jgi:hypothetical protein
MLFELKFFAESGGLVSSEGTAHSEVYFNTIVDCIGLQFVGNG